MTTGFTFTDASNNQASWVMFLPQGVPLSFSTDCTTGVVGSGVGGLYLTNGSRDYSIVLSPLSMSAKMSRCSSSRAARIWRKVRM